MSNIIDAGGPAFPVREADRFNPENNETHTIEQHWGMTLRDFFAAKALQSITPLLIDIDTHIRREREPWVSLLAQQIDASFKAAAEPTLDGAAGWCYEVADAMLAARGVKP